MKKYLFHKLPGLAGLLAVLVLGFASCEKDKDGSPGVAPGAMTNGAIDPGEAPGGEVVTLSGEGIGDIRSIIFDRENVPAQFMSTLNTSNTLVFRVPDTAFGGPQNIIFTNSEGRSLTIPFKVIALPSIISAFPTDFVEGTVVTITGSNLDDANKVLLEGTTDEAQIISQTRKQLVVKMPASSVDRAKIRVTNLSGERLSDFDLVNVSKAITVFSDQFDNNFENWGWGGTFEAAAENIITGSKSLKAAYDPGGTWGGMQLGNGAVHLSGQKYFTFWAKGADVDKNVKFYLNWTGEKTITIPANKWTYFRFELATGWPGLVDIDNVTFQIYDEGKTIYFDNIMFIK